MKSSTLPSRPPILEITANSESVTPITTVSSSQVASTQSPKQSAKAKAGGVWGVFTSTFFTIFLAEMGDKTQLATLLMSAESQSPWLVFAGAGTALIATSLVGVLLGRWLAKCLSPKTLDASAAALLLFIAVTLLWDVVKYQ